MKIAIITGNVGGIDVVKNLIKQKLPKGVTVDRIVIDENNLPFPLPNLDNRTKARYLKMNPHRYLRGYDLFIWLDGRVEVTAKDFVSDTIERARERDFVLTAHPERKDIYDEIEFILHEMNKGNHYLISRYGHQELRRELQFYKENNYENTMPLFASGIFARWNNEICNAACDEWWLRSLEFSNFDQAMLSFVLWNRSLTVNIKPYENRFYKVLRHEHKPY